MTVPFSTNSRISSENQEREFMLPDEVEDMHEMQRRGNDSDDTEMRDVDMIRDRRRRRNLDNHDDDEENDEDEDEDDDEDEDEDEDEDNDEDDDEDDYQLNADYNEDGQITRLLNRQSRKELFNGFTAGFQYNQIPFSDFVLYQLLDYIKDVYISQNAMTNHNYAWKFLGLNFDDYDLKWETIDESFQRQLWRVQRLMQEFVLRELPYKSHDSFPQLGVPIHVFSRIHEVLVSCYYMVVNEWRLKCIVGLNAEVHVPEHVNLFRFSFPDYSNLKPNQQLLIHVLRCLLQHGYRKRGSDCYKEIVRTNPQNGKSYGTRAWKRVMSINDFIYSCVRKETNFDLWDALTSGGDIVKRMVTHLENAEESEFETVRPCRYVFSFANGRYHIWTNTFIPYGYPVENIQLPPSQLSNTPTDRRKQEDNFKRMVSDMTNRDACNFLNLEVDLHWVDSQYNWYDIPTPAFESILASQKLGYSDDATEDENEERVKHTHQWIYVLVGRMLYDLKDKDEWQVLPYFRGIAGTGKSTIATAVKNFYNPEDVGIMSNTIEEKFGLSDLYDKLAWICFEANERMALDQTQFQSVISGESLSCPVKNKSPVRIDSWKPPGMMCGNVIPKWVNTQGSISRRIILTDFCHSIQVSDPMLPRKLASETAALIIKSNRAYIWAVEQFGTQNIWDNLPSYFKEQQAKLEMETDSLFSFVMCGEVLERDPLVDSSEEPQYFISLETFKRLYTEWCRAYKRQLVNIADQNVLCHALARSQLLLRYQERLLAGNVCKGHWIMGVRKKTQTNAQVEEMLFSNENNLGGGALARALAGSGVPPEAHLMQAH